MGTTRVRRLRAAAVTALACLLLLAGCGGDDPAPLVADPTPPASVTPTPTVSAAPQPWEERSKAGAVAFVEHWVEVFNEAGRSGDTAALRDLSGGSCQACLGYARMLDELYGQGGRLDSDGWRILQIGVSERLPIDALTVGFRVERSPEVVIRADGKRESFPGGQANYAADPRWRAGQWQLESLVNVS